MKASNNPISGKCVRPSQGTPHNGSRPNSRTEMLYRIPYTIRKRMGDELAFRLWYDKDMGDIDD